MIERIEKAPSARSCCVKCKQFIPKGSNRGIESGSAFGHMTNQYYCKECTKIKLKDQILCSQNLEIELEK